MPLNQFKNLVDHLHNLITSQKFSYVPKAVNTDYQSQSASILTKGLLEYFDTEKRLPRGRKRVRDLQSFLAKDTPLWIGTRRLVMKKASCRRLTPTCPRQFGTKATLLKRFIFPTDVARDTGSRQFAQDWYIMRDYQNKWDLIAKYPALAEKIKGLAADPDDDTNLRLISNTDFSQTDLIPFTCSGTTKRRLARTGNTRFSSTPTFVCWTAHCRTKKERLCVLCRAARGILLWLQSSLALTPPSRATR
jgi:hypothetical protein